MIKSSTGDTKEYKDLCLQAVSSEEVFNTFKKNPIYMEVLEHVNEKYGLEYANMIKELFPEYPKYLKKFLKNDKYGSPNTFEYEGFGRISPTTLRYIYVMVDLKRIFGDLKNFDICEIGSGYGGQCKIIQDVFNINSYCLVDLPEVLLLNEKYLDKLGVLYASGIEETKSPVMKFDLVISNFAFSELTKEWKDKYLKNIILQSRRGYMALNMFADYTPEELLQKIPGSRLIEGVPKIRKDHYILIWG